MHSNISGLGTTVGVGFFAGIIIGYALKKVVKVVAIVLGLFFTGLAYLQYQQIPSQRYYLMPSVPDVILMIRMLLHLLEIIIISDSNIVGTNGLKAGVRVWQKKINHRLSNVKPE